MKFLVDTSLATMREKFQSELVLGQLLTPLTRYANWGGPFAIDNGGFSGFDAKRFRSLVNSNLIHRCMCQFVTVPDVVGNARRTLEIWRHRSQFVNPDHWPLALVVQDGLEDLDIPWTELQAVFIGGRDPWKDSQAAADVVIAAKILGKHVHVGRVNTARRFKHFKRLGADTCDGSGVAMYDHMLRDIETSLAGTEPDLFANEVETT